MGRTFKTLQAMLLGSLVLFLACDGETSSPETASTPAENAAAPPAADLAVTDAAVHLLPGGMGAAYLRVRAGAADRLLSVRSPLAEAAELHESIDDGGMMRMEPRPDGFEIAAGAELLLAPGGKHVMFHGLAVPDDATETELILQFAHAGERKVRARVVRPGGES